jgi:hypothetical protein
VATSQDQAVRSKVSVRHSRATHTHAVTAVTWPHFRPRLPPLSQSRAAQVMEGFFSLNRSQPLYIWRFFDRRPSVGSVRSCLSLPLSVPSTTFPTVSWHLDSEYGKMAFVVPGMGTDLPRYQESEGSCIAPPTMSAHIEGDGSRGDGRVQDGVLGTSQRPKAIRKQPVTGPRCEVEQVDSSTGTQ